jgi:hypothetical protein
MSIKTQKMRPFIVVILALLCHLNMAPMLAARVNLPKQGNSGYELVQFDLETDKTVVQVSRFGLRIENPKGHTVIVSNPPKWDVVVFSTQTRRMCRTELKNFTGEYHLFFTMFVAPAYADAPFERHGTSTVNGLKVDCYRTLAAYQLQQFASLQKHQIEATFPSQIEYCSCPSLPSTPAIEFVLQSIHRLPKEDGIPMRLTYQSLNGHKVSALNTLAYREKNYTSDNFKIPLGLKNVKNVAAIRADEGSVARAADFVDGVRSLKMRY